MLGLAILGSSCRKDLAYAPSAGHLEFSRDTVFLDTVFTNIGSSTYTLKVYNRTRDDVEIPSIRLGGGENSNYRLNVDGVAGKSFTNIPIFAQDSIFILVETTFDIAATNQTSFLYTDAIQFDSGDNFQEVALVTLVKDAVFLFPSTMPDGTPETIQVGIDDAGNEIRTEGFYLPDDQLMMTNEKPYVIYGYAAVPRGKQLQIEAGGRIHFHKNSGIYVSENSSIRINGALSEDQKLMENEIVFEGDRLEPGFENIAGQWGSLWISKGSMNNTIDHLTVKNATIGLLIEGDGTEQSPALTLKNTQIYNSATINLWGRTASIEGENCVFGTAGNSSLYCNLGGNYSFTHSTIANYWPNGYRSGAALEIDNYNSSASYDLVQAKFVNCIIDGNMAHEVLLRTNESNEFNFFFSYCLLKFQGGNGTDENVLYDFNDIALYEQMILNANTDFWNAKTNDLRIGAASAAKAKANQSAAVLIPFDILGIDRATLPDIGAFQAAPIH
ncbi:MAG: hypothetical protein WBM83_01935 [Flavobacteriaceae bacterium]